MGFKALTVNTAADAAAHIYAQDDAAIFQSIFGADGVFSIGNMFKSTVLTNNTVRLSDGVMNVGGHIGRIEYGDYEDMTIENGVAGYYRNDIIYAKFLTSGDIDTFSLAVKKGAAVASNPTDPALIQGDVYQGAVERDYPLYRVRLEGLSIVAVEKMFTVVPTIPELVEKNNELNNALYPKTKLLPISGDFTFDENGECPVVYSRELAHPYTAILSAGAEYIRLKNATTIGATLVCEELSNTNRYISALIFCVY